MATLEIIAALLITLSLATMIEHDTRDNRVRVTR